MTIPYHTLAAMMLLFSGSLLIPIFVLLSLPCFPLKQPFPPNYITYCFLSLLLASPQGNYDHIIDPIIYCLHENAKYFHPMATIYSSFNVPQEPQMQHHPIEVITSPQQYVS